MDFDLAQYLIHFAMNEATTRRFAVSVVILDAAARPVACARMAKSADGSIVDAYNRAITAAHYEMNKESARLSVLRDSPLHSTSQSDPNRSNYQGGAMLLDKTGELLGWIGIAGASKTLDDTLAKATADSLVC